MASCGPPRLGSSIRPHPISVCRRRSPPCRHPPSPLRLPLPPSPSGFRVPPSGGRRAAAASRPPAAALGPPPPFGALRRSVVCDVLRPPPPAAARPAAAPPAFLLRRLYSSALATIFRFICVVICYCNFLCYHITKLCKVSSPVRSYGLVHIGCHFAWVSLRPFSCF